MIRNQKNISPKETLELVAIGDNPFATFNDIIIKMAHLSSIQTLTDKPADVAQFMVGTNEFAVPIGKMCIRDRQNSHKPMILTQ